MRISICLPYPSLPLQPPFSTCCGLGLMVGLRLVCWRPAPEPVLLFRRLWRWGGGLWEGVATGPCCPKLSCSPHLPWQTVSHEIVSPKSLHTWVVFIGYFVTVARTVTNTVYFFTGLITATLFVSWFFLENGSWIPPHSFTLGWLLSGCLHTLPLMAWVLVHNSCTGASLFLGVPCFGGAHQRVGWQVMSQGNKGWPQGLLHPEKALGCCLPSVPAASNPPAGADSTGQGNHR